MQKVEKYSLRMPVLVGLTCVLWSWTGVCSPLAGSHSTGLLGWGASAGPGRQGQHWGHITAGPRHSHTRSEVSSTGGHPEHPGVVTIIVNMPHSSCSITAAVRLQRCTVLNNDYFITMVKLAVMVDDILSSRLANRSLGSCNQSCDSSSRLSSSVTQLQTGSWDAAQRSVSDH